MIHDLLASWAFRVMASHPPDLVIGASGERAYLNRWYVTPWSGMYRDVPEERHTRWQSLVRHLPNVYVHEFLRSDDDRALHDHPWLNLSVLVGGAYREHTVARGGVNRWRLRRAGTWSGVKLRSPWSAHRVELLRRRVLCRECVQDGIRLNYTCAVCDGRGSYDVGEASCHTIFVTGPKMRRWGFHCRLGWRDYALFLKKTDRGNSASTGCGEQG